MVIKALFVSGVKRIRINILHHDECLGWPKNLVKRKIFSVDYKISAPKITLLIYLQTTYTNFPLLFEQRERERERERERTLTMKHGESKGHQNKDWTTMSTQ